MGLRCAGGASHLLAGIVLFAPAALPAAEAGLSEDVLSLLVENPDGGFGAFRLTLDDGEFDPQTGLFHYAFDDPENPIAVTDVTDPGTVLAHISSLGLTYQIGQVIAGAAGTPASVVNLHFAVQAGAVDSEFTIGSSILTFPPFDPAMGLATAGLTLTDTNGNGAQLTGLHGGGGSYLASYNGMPGLGTTFAELLPSLSAGTFASNTIAADFPGGGAYSPLAGLVEDMSAEWHFLLTAGDLATGTSHFEVIPAPGGLAVFVTGLLFGRRRRRSC